MGAGEAWDVANLPACYFALAGLSVLGDDLSRVNWTRLGQFLVSVQRRDGGFGEWVLEGGLDGEGGRRIMGGEDMRFMYCAMAVRWIMQNHGPGRHLEGVRDIDVDGCVRFIKASMVGKHNNNSQGKKSSSPTILRPYMLITVVLVDGRPTTLASPHSHS